MYTNGTEQLTHSDLQSRLNMSFPIGKPPKGWLIYKTPEPSEAEKLETERQQFKIDRAQAVQQIKVTTAAGNTFDGDEISQGRMARAILAMPEGETVLWVLHDNTAIEASGGELREALALAGTEQARLWVQG